MKIEQRQWTEESGWNSSGESLGEAAHLVLVFGSPAVLKNGCLADLRRTYPDAHFLGCSTAGEIRDTTVRDESMVATAVKFDKTRIAGAQVCISDNGDSFAAGQELASSLPHEGLAHVIVFSDGIHVNGSDLVAGLTDRLPEGVSVTGGLSGDGDRFEETLVLWEDAPSARTVAAIGLYGDEIRVGCGSLGGWDSFGPERLITRAEGNVLYELDGRSALQLYKEYLGEHADGLPATGLLFPLSLRNSDEEQSVVRTILAVDEAAQSMTFAGDLPQGTYARLMKANFDRLIDGAAGAAETSNGGLRGSEPELALLISCVGRKLVLKQRVEEEVESVRDVLGSRAVLTGFYSYGEISPFTPSAKCELHNQTMTITTISED